MKLIADFHVHSRFSRATARDLSLENLYRACCIKGVNVIGTGDFTHPGWFAEIEEKLAEAEPGLFKLKTEPPDSEKWPRPPIGQSMVRFILATEVSNIYKKAGRTRKNHNLVFVPDLEAARRFNNRLGAIGNITSDGRPILGLDARDLLEIVLETSPAAFLVPAHIWTPWFSMLGSKSGFDSLRECFGDLSDEVFAAETGLSSDPPMNRRVSSLDAVCLVSNSDAHSPANVGREATLFDTEPSFFALREALRARDPARFLGTIEFFPEQGKYHWDGHRTCGVCLEPAETKRVGASCPACGEPITVGVLSRVEDLADRAEGSHPEWAPPHWSLVPLADIISEIQQAGPKSGKVSHAYRTALERIGPELFILMASAPDEIAAAGIPLLAEAIGRMRAKRIEIRPGFDGQYGRVQIFSDEERARLQGQKPLFAVPETKPNTGKQNPPESEPGIQASRPVKPPPPDSAPGSDPVEILDELNAEQLRAVLHAAGPLMVVAGPGTGKTHTLTCRIANLVLKRGVAPAEILALTFTHKAAAEMRSRLAALLGAPAAVPLALTFHGLCWSLLRELSPENPITIADEAEQVALVAEAIASAGRTCGLNAAEVRQRIMQAKQNMLAPQDLKRGGNGAARFAEVADVYRAYQHLLHSQGLYDYEELIFQVVTRLENDSAFSDACRRRFKWVFVDEYQDVNHGQYRIIRSLAPPGSREHHLCVIGDPDQSIYAFRGSDPSYFRNFQREYPDAASVQLSRNYRSTETILNASFQVIRRTGEDRPRTYSGIDGVQTVSILAAPNEHAEAEAIARTIEALVGGTGYHCVDTGRVGPHRPARSMSYADLAVLFRTVDQIRPVAAAFETRGIPLQMVSRRHTLETEAIAGLLSLARLAHGAGSYGDLAASARSLTPSLNRKLIEAFRRWGIANRMGVGQGLSCAARFPVPGLSRRQQVKLVEFSGALHELSQAIGGMKSAAERILYLSRLAKQSGRFCDHGSQAALERLLVLAAGADDRPAEFWATLALQVDTDTFHPRAEKVALMTMHASKGLEFPVVFIAGCEEGLIPFRRWVETSAGGEEEERRLFYVAMTRAKERLLLSWSRRRRLFGNVEERRLSPFVSDIEQRLITKETGQSRRRRKGAGQLQLF